MTTSTVTAWLLHKRHLTPSGMSLTLLTAEHGMLQVRIDSTRGLRQKNSALSLFTPLWFQLDERPYGLYVRCVETFSASLHLDGLNLISALYLNELLYYLLHPNEPLRPLYHAYERALTALVKAPDLTTVELTLRRFEWILLDTLGINASFVHEAHAPKSGLDPQAYYHFLPNAGFVNASDGFLGAHILAIADGRLEENDVLKVAKRLMRIAIDYYLDGRVIHSRTLSRELSAARRENRAAG